MVSSVDKIKTQSSFQGILTALSAGLAFLGAPSIGAVLVEQQAAASVKYASQAAVVGLQQAPPTAKSLWPSGTDSSQTYQIGQLKTVLSDALNQEKQRISDTVHKIMGDLDLFLSFSQQGQWVTNETYDLSDKATNLDMALKTLLTSQVLAKNGWYAFPMDVLAPKYTSLDALRAVSTGAYGCKQWADNGICTGDTGLNFVQWWSPTTHRMFQLDQNKNPDQQSDPNPTTLLNEIASNKWADLELLFDGSFNCTWEGRARGDPTVDFGSDGKLEFGCIRLTADIASQDLTSSLEMSARSLLCLNLSGKMPAGPRY
ncbi:uncharacterized protein KY384_001143 [Bacidia gigantensis]|uniref:uncharacterized protein n=1 Tax=Bacidia gigantensis TaxID=2732470 RepID=UPI001D059B9E|nr:uncharacterized protein KY384_001143 [Bacidia gigantensis]KAG8534299.1 hypothetical protein KY384_001143 [Bacidia gigantensis]